MGEGDSPLEVIVGVEKVGSKPKSKDFYPFAYVLNEERKHDHCWKCLQEVVNISCSKCGIAKYCTDTCLKSGDLDHRYECGALLKCPNLPIEQRMLIRIIGRHKDIIEKNDVKFEDFYTGRNSQRTIMEIWDHKDLIKKDESAMKKYNEVYKKIADVMDKEYQLPEETVFELHCRNYINRHSISNGDYMREIGKGLYLDLCRYDHSCRPNAIYSCLGTKATLRALHDDVDLENVETTHYTYIELTPARYQRRHMLKDTWYFDCHCERCDDPDDNWLTSILCPTCLSRGEYYKTLKIHGEDAYSNQDTLDITCTRCHNVVPRELVAFAISGMRTIGELIGNVQGSSTERLQVYQGILVTYERVLSLSNACFCQLIAAMIPLVAHSRFEEPHGAKKRALATFELYEKCEPFVRYAYRYAHPSKAMHFLQMGELLIKLGNGREAARYLIEAHRIMDYVFGQDHILSINTKAIMNGVFDSLKTFQKTFVNVINSVPEAKANLEQKLMTPEEKAAAALAAKEQKKKSKKNKKRSKQGNGNTASGNNNVAKNQPKDSTNHKNNIVNNEDLGDLPELLEDL